MGESYHTSGAIQIDLLSLPRGSYRTSLINLSGESQSEFFKEYPEWIKYYQDFEKFVKELVC